MGTSVRLELDPADKILLKRSLDKNGAGQRFFTHEVRRMSVPYVPRLQGCGQTVEKRLWWLRQNFVEGNQDECDSSDTGLCRRVPVSGTI